MKFREAWRLSKVVAVESMLKGNILMSGGYTSAAAQRDPAKFVQRAKTGFKVNKIVFALVYGSFSVFLPLFMLGPSSTPALQFVVTSMFLVFGLVFLISFNLLNVTSFVSGEALKPVGALPFSREDLARISVLSFFRILDIPLIVFIVGYPIVYGLVTGSIIAAVVILLLNFVNGIIALFLTFFLARGFYRRILSVGGSKIKSFVRTVLTLLFGFATFGMAYLISYMFQWIPQLVTFFSFVQKPEYIWITLIYPFCFGYLATVVSSGFTTPTPQLSLISTQSILAICASAFYIALGYLAYKRGMGALRQLAMGEIEMTPKMTKSGEVKIHVGGVYSSVIKKDLKLASRNAAYAGFLAMPLFGVILFTVIVAGYNAIRVVFVLSALLYSSEFMSFFALSTMWFESRGVSVLAQLPISTRRVVQAKSLAAGALSLMIPAALTIVSLFKPLTTPYSLIMSLIQTLAIYSAALVATTLVCSLFGEGKLPAASFEGHMLKYAFVIMISSIFVIGPLAAYVLTYFFIAQNYLMNTIGMAAAAAVEVILANAIAHGALKD